MICTDPLKTFRNAIAVLVISLGFADLLTGCATAVDVGISHILEGLAIQKVLLQAKIISQITVRAGVFIITMFAVERFIAVVFPYFYRFSVTVRKVTLGCVSCWLLAIISSCLELVVDRDVYDVIYKNITSYASRSTTNSRQLLMIASSQQEAHPNVTFLTVTEKR